MNRKDPARVLDEISQEHVRQGLHLLPGVLKQIEQGTPKIMKPVNKVRFALLLLALVLMFTFFALPGVVSALQKLLGYVPGVGVIDQSIPLRVLAHPVSETRDGFSITIESALLDATQTALQVKIEGNFPQWDAFFLMPKMCREDPFLRLSDGKTLIHPTGGGSGGEWKLSYAGIPSTENHVTIVFPCLAELPAGQGPLNWEIPLDFVPAPPEMTVYPVLNLPTSTPNAAGVDSANSVQLALQSVAQLPTGYYLHAQLTWPADPNIWYIETYPDALHVIDSAGQEVPLSNNDLLDPSVEQTLPLNFETSGPIAPGPARMVLDYVGVAMPPVSPVNFTFDVGAHPKPGQTWTLNQDLLINGYKLKILSAEYIQGATETTPTLMLYLQGGPDLLFATVVDEQHKTNGVGGGSPSDAADDYLFRTIVLYDQAFPTGKITLSIFKITVQRNGPWSVTWTPPISDSIPTPTAEMADPVIALPTLPAETACIQDSAIQAAQAIPQTGLPAGLSGHISFAQAKPDSLSDLGISNLDGSHQTIIENGYGARLSNDATRMVYAGLDQAIHIYTLADQSDISIPNNIRENVYYYAPDWSPDGKQIAFQNIDNTGRNELYLINADGSNLHALLNSTDDQKLLGWAPDSSHIFYIATLADGTLHFRVLDLKTAQTQEIGQLPPEMVEIYPMFIRLSPDGKRMLYANEQGVFLVMVEPSFKSTVLIANRHENFFYFPVWSPDGKWVSLSFRPKKGVSTGPAMVLIQPDTCQFMLVQSQYDEITSWVP